MIDLNPVLGCFAERVPLPVMARAILERCLNAEQLDGWFERAAEAQYTRRLLFSSVFKLMTQVVLRQQPSVHAACRAAVGEIGVSVTSVYNKLNGLEPGISAALVGHAAEQAEGLIGELGAARAPLLAGVRVKVLDGTCLEGREHRLRETRASTAGPLPGKALAVFDPALDLITALYPCEDAYTQERALLGSVLAAVRAGELWIADRNFCTAGFLSGLAERGALALIREHEGLRFTPLEAMREAGRTDAGAVAEQWVRLGPATATTGLQLRRIRVRLDRPTRNGDDTLYLLSTAPVAVADAPTLAALYRERWTLEKAFLHLTVELRCEIDTLAYPSAALFGLACAVVAFNGLGVVKAALRAAHGLEAAEPISGYYLAIELGNVAESLDAVFDARDWAVFQTVPLAIFALWLQQQAARVDLRRYRKSRRGSKKTMPKPVHDPKRPHVSVARLLAQRVQVPSP
jgi:hypothetical protein